MNLDHQFDWNGFSFSAKFVVLVVSIGCISRLAFPYAWPYVLAKAALLTDTAVATSTTAVAESRSTPVREIKVVSITEAVPKTGKFIAADLVDKVLYVFEDGVAKAEYPILTIGRPNSPYETPSGFYQVLTKEQNHFNKGAQVFLPYSMQFYGNYFLHGWPYHTDGTEVDKSYSGGCIRLSTEDASKVFAFAERGTKMYVYDTQRSETLTSLTLGKIPPPPVTAESYLVADIDTGDVLLEKNATTPRPIASVTKLMTALVANETIMFDKEIAVPQSILLHPQATTTATTTSVNFAVGDLLYPLLMESNNEIAKTLAEYYGNSGFIGWMNTTARALNMNSTRYADSSGISPENVSTTEDLYRLAVYLTNKKAFIWNITRTPMKTLVASNGSTFTFNNYNHFYNSSEFVGGKVGQTGQALQTMVSVFETPVNGENRHVAIIVLRSTDNTEDMTGLSEWFTKSAKNGADVASTACATCAKTTKYRKISL